MLFNIQQDELASGGYAAAPGFCSAQPETWRK